MVLAQAAAPAGPDAAEVERIRKALAASPAITLTPAEPRDGPVFKVRIEEPIPGKPWDHWSNVPAYIRPSWPLHHYEFLEQVTPEAFRSATLYPIGIDIVPIIQYVAKQLSAARRKAREEQAREEVRSALEQVLACRADPARPGC